MSQIRYLKDNQMTSEPQNYLSYSALADEIFRAGINYNFYAGYGVYLGYNQIKYSDNSYKLVSANLSGSLNKNWGFYTSAYKDYENQKTMAFTLHCAIHHLAESMRLQVFLMKVVKQRIDKK